MELSALPEESWARLADSIAEHAGLHFPPSRYADLMRGLEAAAREADFQEPMRYAERLLSAPSPRHLQTLTCHLTVGETYFFREIATLEALSQHVLPELIAQRRAAGQRHLRLWSAACSTGEEAYSLAILLDQLLPDSGDWQITLLATDINERALAKAAEGVYGEWSFRALPPGLRTRHFRSAGSGRFAIRPEIAARVTFAPLNLAAERAPGDIVDTRAMDVILCRNVLLYFTPEQARRLARRLHESLAEGGWLAVSPSECSQTLFSRFAVVNFPDAILYQKRSRPECDRIAINTGTAFASGAAFAAGTASPLKQRPSPPSHGSKPLPASQPAESRTPPNINPPFAVLARTSANAGRLSEALTLSEHWIASDKVDPAAHYLHATVLQELGDRDSARRALHRCLFLRPDFALAHFALGTLERSDARHAEATRHFENAQRLLSARPADELLPESEGLTVEHLASIITTLLTAPDA
jgi:chemotaxis protein methyltransferase CheR